MPENSVGNGSGPEPSCASVMPPPVTYVYAAFALSIRVATSPAMNDGRNTDALTPVLKQPLS